MRITDVPATPAIISELEALDFKIANPTASLYNTRTQLPAAIELASLVQPMPPHRGEVGERDLVSG